MQLTFNHIALRAQEPEIMKVFLCTLGFVEGERPNFPFKGTWLYCNGKPMIHIFGTNAKFRKTRSTNEIKNSKHIVDHIGFSHDNYTILMQNIRQHNLTYSSNIVPDTNIAQIFVMGPENLVVEIQAKLN